MSDPLWFHMDIDAFFAAVEVLEHPAYSGKPLIVGALPGHRGVVSTCSYEARKFGVRSAMPVSQAFKLCPQGIYVTPRMDRYQEYSARVMSLLENFTPGIIQVSVDEAFMDMKGTESLWGLPPEAGMRIKKAIHEATGLKVSIGMASNKYCAKIASDFQKPDGLTWVVPGTEAQFVQALPLSKLWGVGKKSRERLEQAGISTVRLLAQANPGVLSGILGKSGSSFVQKAVLGHDPGIYEGTSANQSISNETTFEQDIHDRAVLEDTLFALASQIQFRLRSRNLGSKVLGLKLRLEDFSTFSAQKKQDSYFRSIEEIYGVAKELLARRWDGRNPVRLIGLGFDHVEKKNDAQISLFEDQGMKKDKVEEVINTLKTRFPEAGIRKARLLSPHVDPLNEDKKTQ